MAKIQFLYPKLSSKPSFDFDISCLNYQTVWTLYYIVHLNKQNNNNIILIRINFQLLIKLIRFGEKCVGGGDAQFKFHVVSNHLRQHNFNFTRILISPLEPYSHFLRTDSFSKPQSRFKPNTSPNQVLLLVSG